MPSGVSLAFSACARTPWSMARRFHGSRMDWLKRQVSRGSRGTGERWHWHFASASAGRVNWGSITYAQVALCTPLTDRRVMHPPQRVKLFAGFASVEKLSVCQCPFHCRVDLNLSSIRRKRLESHPIPRRNVPVPGNGFDLQMLAARGNPKELAFDFFVRHFRLRFTWMISSIA